MFTKASLSLALAMLLALVLDMRYQLGLERWLVPLMVCAAFAIVALRFRAEARRTRSAQQLADPRDGALLFAPVWLSSREHLRRFDGVVERASLWQRLFGYAMDEDMPHLVMPPFGAKVPLLCQAIGSLELRDGTLRFSAKPSPKHFGVTWHVDPWLSFTLQASDIVSVSETMHTSPIHPSYMLRWVRLRGETADAEFDLLLAMGTVGVSADVLRTQTRMLHEALERELLLARSRAAHRADAQRLAPRAETET